MIKFDMVALALVASTSVCLAQDTKLTKPSTGTAAAAAQPMTAAPIRKGSAEQHMVPIPQAPKKASKEGGPVGGGSN